VRYICTGCGYVYDPAKGDEMGDVPPGTEWDDLPEDWICPMCYLTKDDFDPLD
jgi:rubredoxin